MTPDSAQPTAFSTRPKPVLHRAIAASAVGKMAEWYDYGVYAYVAVEIGEALLPRRPLNAVDHAPAVNDWLIDHTAIVLRSVSASLSLWDAILP